MFLAKVVGTVVSTQKDPKLEGLKLLLVQQMTIDLKMRDAFHVAADSVGAGKGEVVVCATGSSARMTDNTKNLPVDNVIMAIVDTLEVEGKLVFQKHQENAVTV